MTTKIATQQVFEIGDKGIIESVWLTALEAAHFSASNLVHC